MFRVLVVLVQALTQLKPEYAFTKRFFFVFGGVHFVCVIGGV